MGVSDDGKRWNEDIATYLIEKGNSISNLEGTYGVVLLLSNLSSIKIRGKAGYAGDAGIDDECE